MPGNAAPSHSGEGGRLQRGPNAYTVWADTMLAEAGEDPVRLNALIDALQRARLKKQGSATSIATTGSTPDPPGGSNVSQDAHPCCSTSRHTADTPTPANLAGGQTRTSLSDRPSEEGASVHVLNKLLEQNAKLLDSLASLASLPTASTVSANFPKVNMPKIVIPTFDGNLLDFQDWKDQFDLWIGNFDDRYKMSCLLSSLKGPALRKIQGLG